MRKVGNEFCCEQAEIPLSAGHNASDRAGHAKSEATTTQIVLLSDAPFAALCALGIAMAGEEVL
jgi:hypothetical protein